MKAMRDKETAGSLEQAREALNRALPDEIEALNILRLPDGSMRIEVTLREPSEEENKWACFAEEMHRESPLRGKSEEFITRVRQFRDEFSFNREE
jgi:hypothetical protein